MTVLYERALFSPLCIYREYAKEKDMKTVRNTVDRGRPSSFLWHPHRTALNFRQRQLYPHRA
jgi:hypothetical protein